MRIRISDLHDVCMKHPGMWDDFWRVGSMDGDCISLDRKDFKAVSRRYLKGTLGTKLHNVLKPVVKVIAATTGKDFGECGDCGGRELKINAASSVV